MPWSDEATSFVLKMGEAMGCVFCSRATICSDVEYSFLCALVRFLVGQAEDFVQWWVELEIRCPAVGGKYLKTVRLFSILTQAHPHPKTLVWIRPLTLLCKLSAILSAQAASGLLCLQELSPVFLVRWGQKTLHSLWADTQLLAWVWANWAFGVEKLIWGS